MSILEFILAFISCSELIGLIVCLSTLRSTKRKANAEADSAMIEPLKNTIDILNQQILDGNSRRSEIEQDNDRLHAENSTLKLRLVSLYDDMCIHKGCKLRKPHEGQGQLWYDKHADDPSLGCDYLSVETLLKEYKKRNQGVSIDVNGDEG